MKHGYKCTEENREVLRMFGVYNRLRVRSTASDREVLRRLYAKFTVAKRYAREARTERHAVARAILDYHHSWQQIINN